MIKSGEFNTPPGRAKLLIFFTTTKHAFSVEIHSRVFYVIEHGKEIMTEIIITVALQRDTESGDVHCLSLPVTEEVAERVLNEQEACELLSDGGALAELLNAYAILCGYQCAWFICAEVKGVAKRREDIENSPADCSTPSVTDSKGDPDT